MIDALTALAFSLFENKGVYALLLGSGLSRAAQIPTGWEITLDLIRRIAADQGIADEPDWSAWYRQQTAGEPDYSDILDRLTTTPEERRSILHSYIDPTAADIEEGRKVPTTAHHAIAWLVREGFIKVILTTNFDRLLENALREAGVEPTVIASDDDLRGAVPLIHSRCYVVKLHGDYLDTRIKNTDAELGTYSEALNGLLDRILDDHGLIVCGWSGDWDHALRAAITRAPNRRFPTFWAARGSPSTRADDLIRQRGAKVIQITDGDSFFGGMRQRIAAQIEAQRPDPRSVAMLVATTKRYLARPEFRIALNDILAEATHNLSGKLGEAEFPRHGQGTPTEYRRRVLRYEAAAEPLVRVLGVVGRWGDDAAHRLCCDVLTSLADLKTEGGLVVWLELRFYPAALLFYAYGLGALQAERYDLLFHWFSQLNIREERKPVAMVHKVAHWIADTFDQWKMLDGLAQRKTPLSDHLHEISTAWTADYTIADGGQTLLFETFEMLIALGYLTVTTTKEKLEAVHAGSDESGRNFAWSPIGRSVWDGQTRGKIFSALEQPALRKALLDAGFARGDERHLSLSTESVQRNLARSGLSF